jgi:hypothetical protein
MAHAVWTVSASAEAQNWPARALAGKPEDLAKKHPLRPCRGSYGDKV